jgi:hypothetical protein
MAYRRKIATIGGDCMEKIQFFTPEHVWVDHPTRGGWQPCGTYPPVRYETGGVKNPLSSIDMKNGSVFVSSKSMVRYPPGLDEDELDYLDKTKPPEKNTETFKKIAFLVVVIGAVYVVVNKL